MRFVVQEVEWISGSTMPDLLRDPILFWRPFHGAVFHMSMFDMDRLTLTRYIELHDTYQMSRQ